ncbi:unnamed protein product [Amaranthus hypochondriacus]
MASLRTQLSCPRGLKSVRTTKIHYPKSSSLPAGTITEFVWKDYNPLLFRNIQYMGDVKYEDYMQAVCNHETLMELAHRGCGGKPFYVSQDDRFVIKILRKSEAKVLLGMLPSYYSHILNNKNTLLAKYYGLHASRPSNGGEKVFFVVMENLLRTELLINKRYDLKGSSQGRSATKNGSQDTLTLKDLALDLCFHLDPTIRNRILEQIKVDCEFLEEQGIMDYSLLLGMHMEPRRDSLKNPIQLQNGKDHPQALESRQVQVDMETSHRRDPTFSHFTSNRPNITRFGSEVPARVMGKFAKGNDNEERDSPSSTRSTSRLHDQSNNVYLFIGIIDFLEKYTMIKRMEHAIKSLKYDSKTISAVNPQLYSTRFQEFLCNKVFLVQDHDFATNNSPQPLQLHSKSMS